jgi:hypothetical protein
MRNDRFANIRIHGTGQVTEMAPDVARALISSSMAEEVTSAGRPETMALGRAETAVTAAQHPSNKARGRKN